MPPAAARNYAILLFDLKVKSLPAALNSLSKILLYKDLACPKNFYNIYLINSNKMDADIGVKGVSYLDCEGVKIGEILREIQSAETGDCDWLEALEFGISGLKEQYEAPGIMTLQLILISDLTSCSNPNEQNCQQLIYDISEYDIFFYIIGPAAVPPFFIMNKNDVQTWMSNLKVDETNKSFKISKKLVQRTPNSVLCSYDLGLHLINSMTYNKGGQPWLVPLSFGSKFELPVSTIRITKKEAPIKLKSITTGNRYADYTKWVLENQEDVEVHYEDAIGGLVQHGMFVKIETDKAFKIDGSRCFSVLGFTHKSNIPDFLLQGDGSYMVISNMDQSPERLEFFCVLIDQMAKMERYAVARRVYMANCTPKFVALIPRPDLKSLLLCELPYADDVTYTYGDQDPLSAPPVRSNEEIVNFLDGIDLCGDDCKIKVPLAPQMMVQPSCIKIIEKVEEKVLDEKVILTKFNRESVDNYDFAEPLKLLWPVRDLVHPKKEENSADDFDEIGDFSFS